MEYIVQKVDNNLNKLQHIYNTRTRNYNGFYNLRHETRDYFQNNSGDVASYFESKRDTHCFLWHTDSNGASEHYTMLISSFPNPTQILIPKNETVLDILDKYNKPLPCQRNDYDYRTVDTILDKYIKRWLKNGDAEIFTPEPGDIYYLGPRVIHRPNPKALGTKHLVMRIWNPCL